VGSYLVGSGTGFRLTNDDWNDLYILLSNEREALNRTPSEVAQLHDTLEGDLYTEVWVARNPEGGMTGFVALHLGRKVSDRHTASLRIHVAEEARGAGLGSKLLKTALKWADANGITRITATPYVQDDFQRKLGFFTQHGFASEGYMRGAVKVAGQLVDVTQLARVR
jgi:L-amino acid N-acyltransferase YncA